jgi:hypothetical protein
MREDQHESSENVSVGGAYQTKDVKAIVSWLALKILSRIFICARDFGTLR